MSATTEIEKYNYLETTTKKKLLDKKKKKWGVKSSPSGNPWKRQEDDNDDDDKDLGSVIFDAKNKGRFRTRKQKREIARGIDPYDYD